MGEIGEGGDESASGDAQANYANFAGVAWGDFYAGGCCGFEIFWVVNL
jgi:hypothetical protein